MAAVVRVLDGGRIRLPSEVQEQMKLHVGDYVSVEVKRGDVVLKPVEFRPRDEAET
jgi:AbrB family looped-hinge helix DNA binding protein